MRLSARSTNIDFNHKYETGYCIPLWLRDLQIKDNLKRIKDRVEIGERKKEPIAIVGYGPSLKKTWEELKKFKYIITTSGAHKFLIERGIIPTFHLDVDPRSHKVELLGKIHKDVIYTPCSTVHKTYIDYLKKHKAKVRLWHYFSADHDAMRIIPQGEYTLTGGCDAGMRAIFGIHLKNDKSKLPECVGPSCPTIPALSTANNMGIFCKATSCIN